MYPLLVALLAAPAAPSAYRIRDVEGREVIVANVVISEKGLITLGEGMTSSLAKISFIQQQSVVRPAWPRRPGVILTQGDRLSGKVLGGDDRSIRFQPDDLTEIPWQIPLPLIAAVWQATPPLDLPPVPASYLWLRANRKLDTILFRNGDVLEATLEQIRENGGLDLRLQDGKPRVAEPAALAAIALNPSLAVTRKPRTLHARIVTDKGHRLMIANIRSDGQRLQGKTLFNATVDLDWKTIIDCQFYSNQIVDVTDLTPVAKVEPYLGLSWMWTKNSTVKNRLMQLIGPQGVDTYESGLGTHPTTTLTYNLAGKYRRFESLVGLDAATGRRGSAQVRILVDDQPVPVEGLETLGAEKPVWVQVPLLKAKKLTLMIGASESGDVQADVNWVNPKILE